MSPNDVEKNLHVCKYAAQYGRRMHSLVMWERMEQWLHPCSENVSMYVKETCQLKQRQREGRVSRSGFYPLQRAWLFDGLIGKPSVCSIQIVWTSLVWRFREVVGDVARCHRHRDAPWMWACAVRLGIRLAQNPLPPLSCREEAFLGDSDFRRHRWRGFSLMVLFDLGLEINTNTSDLAAPKTSDTPPILTGSTVVDYVHLLMFLVFVLVHLSNKCAPSTHHRLGVDCLPCCFIYLHSPNRIRSILQSPA